LAAVVSHIYGRARAFEEFDSDLLIDLVILSEQDAGAAKRLGDFMPVGRCGGDGYGFGSEYTHQAVNKHGPGNWFDEEPIHMQPLGFLAHLFSPKCRNNNDGRLFSERGVILDESRRLKAIHSRHPPIHKHDVIRRVVVALPDRCNRLRSGTNGVGAFGQIVHRFDEDFARRGVVVYDEDVQRLQSIWDDPLWGGVANLEPRSEMKGAA